MPAEILQSLDETLAQINQMSEMVENLLTLARADEGRAPLAVEEADLRDMLGETWPRPRGCWARARASA